MFACLTEFADLVAVPVNESVQRGERVLAVVAPEVENSLREHLEVLGVASDAVEFARPELVFATGPQTTVRDFGQRCAELVASGPAAIVAHYQPWMDAYVLALRECLGNLAFARAPLTVFCGCSWAEPGHHDVFFHTHPSLWSHDGAVANPDFRKPRDVLASHPAPALAPLRDPDQQMDFDGGDLRTLRRFVTHHGTLHGLDGAEALELAQAANEVAANSVEHGGGRGRLAIWHEPGELIWEIRDSGKLDLGQLFGLATPKPNDRRGRGLWMARRFVDDLYIWQDSTGTAVRAKVSHRYNRPSVLR